MPEIGAPEWFKVVRRGEDDGLAFTGDLNSYVLLKDPELQMVDIEGENFVELTYDRRVNADEAAITIESADDLGDWAPAAMTRVSEIYDGERSTVTFRSTAPVEGLATGFYRLKMRLK